MKKLTFVIIGGKQGEHAHDLLTEISEREHIAIPVRMKSIVFSIEQGIFRASHHDFDLAEGDVFLFRGGYRTVKPGVATLANHLLSAKKTVINDDLGKTGFFGDKVFQANRFAQFNIPHPRTMQALSLKDVPKIIDHLGLPIIAKPIFGSKGHGIMKFDSKNSVIAFLKTRNRKYFLQEYVPINGDFRIFIVGNRVIAGMKRHILKGDFRSNSSLGASASKIIMTPSLQKLAIKAAQSMDYEIAGVDIIEHNGKFLVLEVNSAPQWKKLKEVTGINPSKAIIDYALQKYTSITKETL